MNDQDFTLQSTKAINDICSHEGLEYAQLTPEIRTLLIKCYIRGAKDILKVIRESGEEIIKKL